MGSGSEEHADDWSPPLGARRRPTDVAESSAHLNIQGRKKNPFCTSFAEEEDGEPQALITSADQNVQETVHGGTELC